MSTRNEIADLILPRLRAEAQRMRSDFAVPGHVPSASIDDLLPVDLAQEIYDGFPPAERMMLKRSIKEHKLVAAQMDAYSPLLEEAVYAFQDPRVVEVIGAITGMAALEPDTELYAGGISLMSKGGYLRPHLDNSHDGDHGRYRVLNLLYYVSPGWREDAAAVGRRSAQPPSHYPELVQPARGDGHQQDILAFSERDQSRR
jgi:Rps23 Pro-64 3,4-dihydroxylase Tpa1-like proline 4-hydroxylase